MSCLPAAGARVPAGPVRQPTPSKSRREDAALRRGWYRSRTCTAEICWTHGGPPPMPSEDPKPAPYTGTLIPRTDREVKLERCQATRRRIGPCISASILSPHSKPFHLRFARASAPPTKSFLSDRAEGHHLCHLPPWGPRLYKVGVLTRRPSTRIDDFVSRPRALESLT
jgi:hypothetical protein